MSHSLRKDSEKKSEREGVLTDEQRWNKLMLLYFPMGHLAVGVRRVKDSEADARLFDGYYLSHGGGNTEKEDKSHYGKCIEILLDLPEGMTLASLQSACSSFNAGSYNFATNNCADAGLKFLRDALHYDFLTEIKTRAMTTPQHVALLAARKEWQQNENDREDVLKSASSPFRLGDLLLLLQCEIHRLEIEINLQTIKAAIVDWKTISNFREKVWENMELVFDANIKQSKIDHLKKLEKMVKQMLKNKNYSRTAYQEVITALIEQQKIIGGRTADALKVCIEHFPYEELPGENERFKFLIELHDDLIRNEAFFKKQTLLGSSLPNGIIALKNELKMFDKTTAGISLTDEEMQKLFLKVQQMLQEKANDKGSRTPELQKIYDDWNREASELVRLGTASALAGSPSSTAQTLFANSDQQESKNEQHSKTKTVSSSSLQQMSRPKSPSI